ncbi:RNA recognition motif domain [Macleaya cordata]|uniref:RNA recognition motif domain n=1 Tax=Macleaya cordata TaxID=56857 RepID=A0A200PYR0_MACCD|nr:RNA recognition motif domain [Macleaya cordata]
MMVEAVRWYGGCDGDGGVRGGCGEDGRCSDRVFRIFQGIADLGYIFAWSLKGLLGFGDSVLLLSLHVFLVKAIIMATAFSGPVSATQVGSYFVGQYYQVLQQQPDFVHQFYTDASTMLRVDGSMTERAVSMLQIHSLITSLNFTEIEIKTAHSLDSWSGSVLVMVLGSVQMKDYRGRRKFAQTFFLAPQEKGYFVLNDIFHFLDEDQIHQHPSSILGNNHFDSKLDASTPFPEPVSDCVQAEETQAREFEAPTHVEENYSVEQYSPLEQQEQHLLEVDNAEETIVEETPLEEPTPSYLSEMNTVQDSPPIPVVEPVGEPQKKTYASILRVSKGHSTMPVASQPSVNKSIPPTSEWHHAPQPNQQAHPALRIGSERSSAEPVEEVAAFEEQGEGRSVYVRNLPSTISASEIELEFKNFGRIKPEGVAIRNRTDIGVCYAFVEFEDAVAVQNAIKASPVQLSGRLVHIEERRANTNSISRGGRGGRGGRGRGGYQTEAPRGGRFGGRSFGRGSGQDGDYYSSNRSRGNGFRGSRQDSRGILGNQVSSRNGLNPLD